MKPMGRLLSGGAANRQETTQASMCLSPEHTYVVVMHASAIIRAIADCVKGSAMPLVLVLLLRTDRDPDAVRAGVRRSRQRRNGRHVDRVPLTDALTLRAVVRAMADRGNTVPHDLDTPTRHDDRQASRRRRRRRRTCRPPRTRTTTATTPEGVDVDGDDLGATLLPGRGDAGALGVALAATDSPGECRGHDPVELRQVGRQRRQRGAVRGHLAVERRQVTGQRRQRATVRGHLAVERRQVGGERRQVGGERRQRGADSLPHVDDVIVDPLLSSRQGVHLPIERIETRRQAGDLIRSGAALGLLQGHPPDHETRDQEDTQGAETPLDGGQRLTLLLRTATAQSSLLRDHVIDDARRIRRIQVRDVRLSQPRQQRRPILAGLESIEELVHDVVQVGGGRVGTAVHVDAQLSFVHLHLLSPSFFVFRSSLLSATPYTSHAPRI